MSNFIVDKEYWKSRPLKYCSDFEISFPTGENMSFRVSFGHRVGSCYNKICIGENVLEKDDLEHLLDFICYLGENEDEEYELSDSIRFVALDGMMHMRHHSDDCFISITAAINDELIEVFKELYYVFDSLLNVSFFDK